MPVRKSLHLASASPRRREILEALGLDFSFAGVNIDESPLPAEAADAMVVRLALRKAEAAPAAGSVIIGADTTVVLGDRIFGKPASEEEGINMLLALSGTTHAVCTGIAVRSAAGTATALSRSEVRFRDIDPAEAVDYWHSGEPRGKAGGYAIQGTAGIFVAELIGSYSGVVGLPVFETAELLRSAGIDVLQRAGNQS